MGVGMVVLGNPYYESKDVAVLQAPSLHFVSGFQSLILSLIWSLPFLPALYLLTSLPLTFLTIRLYT